MDAENKTGFQSSGSVNNKKGQAYGEAAKLNQMPPGENIADQEDSDIRDLPMKTIIAGSYPGDGW